MRKRGVLLNKGWWLGRGDSSKVAQSPWRPWDFQLFQRSLLPFSTLPAEGIIESAPSLRASYLPFFHDFDGVFL